MYIDGSKTYNRVGAGIYCLTSSIITEISLEDQQYIKLSSSQLASALKCVFKKYPKHTFIHCFRQSICTKNSNWLKIQKQNCMKNLKKLTTINNLMYSVIVRHWQHWERNFWVMPFSQQNTNKILHTNLHQNFRNSRIYFIFHQI